MTIVVFLMEMTNFEMRLGSIVGLRRGIKCGLFRYLCFNKETFIDRIFFWLLSVVILSGCSSSRDSVILGVGTGAASGGVVGSQVKTDRGENAIKGALIGGIVGGVASYIIHGSLESRDERVRKETLLSLEKFDVMGRGERSESAVNGDKCHTTREVDGRLVSIPCRYVDDAEVKP